MTNQPALLDAIDPAELGILRARWGDFALETVTLTVAPPFLTGENQLLTSRGRRAEVCYVMHEGDPQAGVLLHRKHFYPADGFRLPTGGIQQGEAVEATLTREIQEETGLLVGGGGETGVVVERLLGVVGYSLEHATLGGQRFATYHFLVRKNVNASLVPQDESESIAAWRWAPASTLPTVAATLDALAAGPRPEGGTWGDWGRFRAISHRFVAHMLAKRG
jgi:8-oxo-dGTP pyrophosphatase MutT (NUDIX family)